MIDLNTLEEQCPKCNGKGGVENTIWYQDLARHNYKLQIIETKDRLNIIEEEDTDRTGKSRFFFCRDCHGRGKVLTAKGRRLMEFVRCWMNPNY